jgi:hypothetical protein
MTKPGEDLPRMDVLSNVPDGMVAVREPVSLAEGMALHGFLTSADIPAAVVSASAGLHTYTRQQPMFVGVYVPPDRFDEAEALLADVGDGLAEQS